MARRYCKLPSELRRLSLSDFEFNAFIASVGSSHEHEQAKKGMINGKK